MYSYFILLFLLLPQISFAAGCNQACLSSSNCTAGGGCEVCVGVCVGCSDLGDAAQCADAGTGAADFCYWDGTTCLAEIPKWLLPFLAAILPVLGLYLFRRKIRLAAIQPKK